MSIYKCKLTRSRDAMEPGPIYPVEANKPYGAAVIFLERLNYPQKGYLHIVEGRDRKGKDGAPDYWEPYDPETITINTAPFLQKLYGAYRDYSNDFFTGPDGTNPPYNYTVYIKGLFHGHMETRLETITAATPNEAANITRERLEREEGLERFFEIGAILNNLEQAKRDKRPGRPWRAVYEGAGNG